VGDPEAKAHQADAPAEVWYKTAEVTAQACESSIGSLSPSGW
jgi:hypothetical protein